jgi:hypothetical protein
MLAETAVPDIAESPSRTSDMETGQAFDAFFRILEAVLLALIAYIAGKIRELSGRVEGTQNEVNKVSTILIGADGKNGLRSRIRRLEVKVDQLALQQAARHGEAPTIVISDEDDS